MTIFIIQDMNENAVKYLEFVIFSLYLIIIFLSVQAWFICRDINTKTLKSGFLLNYSIIKNSFIIIIILSSIFFAIPELFEEIKVRNSNVYFEFSELMGFIFTVVLIYIWHSTLKTYADKQPLNKILLDARIGHQRSDDIITFWTNNKKSKFILVFVSCLAALSIALYVPVSSIFFGFITGFVFGLPAITLLSALIGASLVSKELSMAGSN